MKVVAIAASIVRCICRPPNDAYAHCARPRRLDSSSPLPRTRPLSLRRARRPGCLPGTARRGARRCHGALGRSRAGPRRRPPSRADGSQGGPRSPPAPSGRRGGGEEALEPVQGRTVGALFELLLLEREGREGREKSSEGQDGPKPIPDDLALVDRGLLPPRQHGEVRWHRARIPARRARERWTWCPLAR